MKIGIVCYPTFGGSGVVATELGKSFAEKGAEVHFITYKQPVRLAYLNQNIFFHEVFVPSYPLFKYQPYELALSSKIVDTVKQYKLDLVHVHYAIPNAYAAFMAKQILSTEGIKLPVVTTLHGSDITLVGSHADYKPAVTFSVEHSDYVTAVSESLKKDTIKKLNVKKHIEVIPNFINPKKWQNAFTDCSRNNMAHEKTKIVTHISNFRKVKRIPDVISIFDKIQKKVDAKLFLIGEGPEKAKAEENVNALGLRSKVHFLGNSVDVDKVLCFSDIFLLPSETESFGLVALEAMANATPVISSNTGGIPEVMVNNITGFMHDVGDVNSMATSAIKLLKDDALIQQFKTQAKNHSKKFEIDIILPHYEQAYTKALDSVHH